MCFVRQNASDPQTAIYSVGVHNMVDAQPNDNQIVFEESLHCGESNTCIVTCGCATMHVLLCGKTCHYDPRN